MDIVTQLKNLIATNFANNTTNQITEGKLREVSWAMVDDFSTAVEITRAGFLALYNPGKLRPGTYKITDSGDAGIFVRATDGAGVSMNATGVFLNPDFQNINGNNVGVWNTGLGGLVAGSSIAIRNGFHFLNRTGAVGTDPEGDHVNWQLTDKPDISYVVEYDLIEYDVVTDIILRRRDKRGNNISSDTNHFQWGNDKVIWNTDSDVSSWDINNNNGWLIGNSLSKGATLYVGESNVGQIIGNAFNGCGNIVCNLSVTANVSFCTVNTALSLTFEPAVTVFQKLIEDKYSDVEKVMDITGSNAIILDFDLDKHIGVVTLTSSNGTETIQYVKNLPVGRRIRVYTPASCAVTFDHTVDIYMLGNVDVVLTSTPARKNWIEFENIGGSVHHVATGKY